MPLATLPEEESIIAVGDDTTGNTTATGSNDTAEQTLLQESTTETTTNKDQPRGQNVMEQIAKNEEIIRGELKKKQELDNEFTVCMMDFLMSNGDDFMPRKNRSIELLKNRLAISEALINKLLINSQYKDIVKKKKKKKIQEDSK